MFKYVTMRIIYMFITLFIIASLSFFLMKLLPGSPIAMEEKLTPEQLEIILERYGLNDPVPVQYFNYIVNLAQGDLGISFQFDNREVSALIMDRIGPSLHLGMQSLVFGVTIGLILGIIAAMRHNTAWDHGSTLIAVMFKSIPSFVFAGVLQYFIGVKFGWLPVAFWEGPEYTILPMLALSTFALATSARFIRTEMLEVIGSDYITLAKAKGLSESVITIKHILRNALIPLVTLLGSLTVSMMVGNLVIEEIFAVPGLGEQFVRSIQMNDFPMIMGTTLFFSALFIFVMLVVDLLYGVIDPRIRVHAK